MFKQAIENKVLDFLFVLLFVIVVQGKLVLQYKNIHFRRITRPATQVLTIILTIIVAGWDVRLSVDNFLSIFALNSHKIS